MLLAQYFDLFTGGCRKEAKMLQPHFLTKFRHQRLQINNFFHAMDMPTHPHLTYACLFSLESPVARMDKHISFRRALLRLGRTRIGEKAECDEIPTS